MPKTTSYSSSDSDRHAPAAAIRSASHARRPVAVGIGRSARRGRRGVQIYGQLNARRDNAVLICHAISGDSHVARHDAQDDPGWWDIMVGPGKSIDTDRYFVICPEHPGRMPRHDRAQQHQSGDRAGPTGIDFPVITVGDMVEVQRRLVDQLGIERLLAVVGARWVGTWCSPGPREYPDRVAGAVALATSPRSDQPGPGV